LRYRRGKQKGNAIIADPSRIIQNKLTNVDTVHSLLEKKDYLSALSLNHSMLFKLGQDEVVARCSSIYREMMNHYRNDFQHLLDDCENRGTEALITIQSTLKWIPGEESMKKELQNRIASRFAAERKFTDLKRVLGWSHQVLCTSTDFIRRGQFAFFTTDWTKNQLGFENLGHILSACATFSARRRRVSSPVVLFEALSEEVLGLVSTQDYWFQIQFEHQFKSEVSALKEILSLDVCPPNGVYFASIDLRSHQKQTELAKQSFGKWIHEISHLLTKRTLQFMCDSTPVIFESRDLFHARVPDFRDEESIIKMICDAGDGDQLRHVFLYLPEWYKVEVSQRILRLCKDDNKLATYFIYSFKDLIESKALPTLIQQLIQSIFSFHSKYLMMESMCDKDLEKVFRYIFPNSHTFIQHLNNSSERCKSALKYMMSTAKANKLKLRAFAKRPNGFSEVCILLTDVAALVQQGHPWKHGDDFDQFRIQLDFFKSEYVLEQLKIKLDKNSSQDIDSFLCPCQGCYENFFESKLKSMTKLQSILDFEVDIEIPLLPKLALPKSRLMAQSPFLYFDLSPLASKEAIIFATMQKMKSAPDSLDKHRNAQSILFDSKTRIIAEFYQHFFIESDHLT
jgi:hypothetical protein